MLIDCSDIQLNKLIPQNDFEIQVVSFLQDWFNDSKYVKVKTSGSTGLPKVFDVEKHKMLSSAKMTTEFLNLEIGNTALLCLPVEYISGKMMLVRALFKKLNVVVKDPSLHPINDLDDPIDFCAMTPLQVENSLDKLHLIKNLIIGGAAVSDVLKSKLMHFKTNIYETYGMSETLSHIALKKLSPTKDDYFTCFDGVEISLDDRGCLAIYAPNVNSEFLKTNDLVHIINKKQFVFLGRVDNVINSGGAKILPEQLEMLAKEKIDREIIYLGIKDDSLGQKLVAIVEGDANDEIATKILSLDYQKNYHKPKSVIFVKKIPRTPNGKVSRLELLTMFKS